LTMHRHGDTVAHDARQHSIVENSQEESNSPSTVDSSRNQRIYVG
jgi:hypothetical protein